MSRARLTKGVVEAAEPGVKDRFLWDAEVVGFGVKVTPAGGRIYVLQRRAKGRSRRYTIGRHGDPWTVPLARDRARRLLSDLANGREPRPPAQNITLDQLVGLYFDEGAAGLVASTREQRLGMLRNHVLPVLGETPVRAITATDIDRLFIAVARGLTRKRGGPIAANAVLQSLSVLFVFGMRRDLCDDNPVRGAKRFRQRQVTNVLAPSDLARIGAVLEIAEVTGLVGASALGAIRLILLTGLSPSEAGSLRGTDVDFERGCLNVGPQGRLVHVGRAVLAELGALPVTSLAAPAFPGPDGRPISRKALHEAWRRLRVAAGLPRVRLQDLSYAFGAEAAKAGVSLKIVGALMGVRGPAALGRYGEFATPQVKAAADRIAGELSAMLGAAAKGLVWNPPPAALDAGARAARDEISEASWLTTGEAATLSGYTPEYLSVLRSQGLGPSYRRLGRRILYDADTLAAWIAERPRRRGSLG